MYMEIQYHLTEEDYVKFNLFFMKNSETARKALNMQRFLAPVFFIFVSFLLAKIADMNFIGLFVIFAVISILWIWLYPKYFDHFVIRKTRKVLSEADNPGLLGEHRLLLSEEGITETTAKSETRAAWSGIQDIKEDQHSLYLFNSAVSAFIIPKRATADIQAVKAFVMAKMHAE